MYRVHHLGNFVTDFDSREALIEFLDNQPNPKDYTVTTTVRADIWMLRNGI